MIKANQGIRQNSGVRPSPDAAIPKPASRSIPVAALRQSTPIPNRPSRQKTQQSCLIKPHQGIGQIFQQPSVRPSTRWIGRTGYRMAKRVPRRNPLLGERKQVRASVITNQSLFAPPHPQSRQKPQQSCMIKAYQGIGQKHPSPWTLGASPPELRNPGTAPNDGPFSRLTSGPGHG